MTELSELLGYSFNQRALLAAAIIGLVNGYLSAYVVLRRSALFTGALTHTMFPGIAIGFILFGIGSLSAFFGALIASLVLGLIALGISQSSRVDKDSALAILWTTGFAAGLLLIDKVRVNIEIEDYLFGNILGLANDDLWYTWVVGGAALGTLVVLQRPLLLFIFEPDVAAVQGVPVRALNYLLATLQILVMITSVQAVGVILALGLLVAPGAIMYLFVDSPRAMMWGGGLIGMVLATAAILLSNLWNIRTGATIVLLLGLCFLLAYLLSPRYGLLPAQLRKHPSQHS